jgi:PHD/YefM family antitoxin component YafN of YafNO toxin-antitoxin module
MTTIPIAEARECLDRLVGDAATSHEAITICGERGNAVLVGEDDWRAMQETLYLISIPGVREAIIEGIDTPLDECANEPEW